MKHTVIRAINSFAGSFSTTPSLMLTPYQELWTNFIQIGFEIFPVTKLNIKRRGPIFNYRAAHIGLLVFEAILDLFLINKADFEATP